MARRVGSNSVVPGAGGPARLAALSEHSTTSPLAIRAPETTTSRRANRGNATWTTERWRRSSSTSPSTGISPSRTKRHSAGFLSRTRDPRASVLAVVSSPPVSTPSASPASSLSPTSSPCSRTSMPSRPSPGDARCCRTHSVSCAMAADVAPSKPSGPSDASKWATLSSWNSGRLACGTPSSSQIVRAGTGSAKDRTRSTGPGSSAMASSRASMISSITGASLPSRRAVNSGVSRRRSLVCSGGSLNPRPPGCLPASTPAPSTSREKSLLNASGPPRTALASSRPVTSQMVTPNHPATLVTGSAPCSRPWPTTGSIPSRRRATSTESGSNDPAERPRPAPRALSTRAIWSRARSEATVQRRPLISGPYRSAVFPGRASPPVQPNR